jgi:hypothetical protein
MLTTRSYALKPNIFQTNRNQARLVRPIDQKDGRSYALGPQVQKKEAAARKDLTTYLTEIFKYVPLPRKGGCILPAQ